MSTYKKKKIALLINAFWNSGAGISGGDQRAMQIFCRLEKKFDIDIYTSADGKKVFNKEIKSAKYIVSPQEFEKGNVLLRYWRRSNWLTGKLAEKKYSVIYSSSDFFPDVTPAHVYKKNNPRVLWVSCVFHIYPNWRKRPGNKFINLIGTRIQIESFKKIRSLADKVVNINYQVRDELAGKYKFDKQKIIVNPCGIDLKYFENIKAKKQPLQVCFIARLVPSKGIFDLADIWSQVAKKMPTAKLKIIGGGSEEIKQKLRSSFERSELCKNVEILGFLENDKAYKILKGSALFIFPSYEEGFGIAIAEAFACGVPAVTWDLPVYKEVFPKGLAIAKIGDTGSFAKNVSGLLSDKKKLFRLAVEALDVVQKYDWDGIAKTEMSFFITK
ncbi:MAG: GDP-mannose-dependent alpha-(1-2)-phosphatidylinositol mannosyltransferase [candidate division WS2 bacterium ADurb.Bin280]|uniref:GDP-mannose-dependent alpha-(1-2)-phosphatidylinositol mannosyltransferase n=1 Tax=candidate division WS2 bacterium ADurb.Bin280 TaxID=1852829 RepID=A0A1V5SCK8_9BACT|nr:MAG: GDP-mannose-dependent alpha-(1-2)-phosphatidylinositol mannosyltransferase [candidate division WS2 bacterium ADurb.Bin280]